MHAGRHRERGFTLPELMIVVSIAAIILTAASVGFDSAVSNGRRATGINQLVSMMHAARSEAITRNLQVTMCPSDDGATCSGGGDWQSGWIYFTDADQSRAPDGDDQVLGGTPELVNLSIESAEFADFIAFRPNGRITSGGGADAGQFTVCDHRGATYARVVILNSSGEPRLSETTSGGGTPTCPDM
jgi:type IV fimbrial biogenesis protein FimT